MKKFTAIILTAAIALAFAACSESGTGGEFSTSASGTEENVTTVRTTARTERVTTEPETEPDIPEDTGDSEEEKLPSGIRPEFKEMLDGYEEFFNEYAQFMLTYSESDDPFAMLTDYLDMLQRYTDAMEALDEIGEEEMSEQEALYYTEVMLRIEMKLLDSLAESGGTEETQTQN